MTMTFDKWVAENLGKYIDYDGVYGVQCVDLAKSYIRNVLGFVPQSIGNAINYFTDYGNSDYLQKHFIRIFNTPDFVPRRGDLGIFKTKSGMGHIVVCTGDGTTSWFTDYEENTDGKGSPMKLVKRGYTNFLGVLRPKNQDAIGNSNCKRFKTNACVTKKSKTYCDSDMKIEIGCVNKSERVRVLKTCEDKSFIQYSINDTDYKVGIVMNSVIDKD